MLPDFGYAVLLVVAIVFFVIVRQARQGAKDESDAREKQEALFRAAFPELQPNFHPQKILDFVNGWEALGKTPPNYEWNYPLGLGFAKARFAPMGTKGRPVEFLDAAGATVARALLLNHPDGAVIRIGQGKFTVNLRDSAVRYWHPEREFKWSKRRGWRVLSALSDRGIDSSDRGMSFSSDSSSSSATTAAAAAAGAVAIAGAGGAFDGGGSSSSWESSSESKTSY